VYVFKDCIVVLYLICEKLNIIIVFGGASCCLEFLFEQREIFSWSVWTLSQKKSVFLIGQDDSLDQFHSAGSALDQCCHPGPCFLLCHV
jgi:hypothetical protein